MALGMRSISTILSKIGCFHLLAHILCISFFSVQMYNLVQKLVVPTITQTYIGEVPLKDMDFPLDLKICVNPSMNQTALKEFGYEDATEYIIGSSWTQTLRSNFSMIGWGGLGPNNTSLASAKEIYDAVKLRAEDNLNATILIITYDDILISKNLSIVDLVQMNPLHACHILTFDHENLKSLQKDSLGMKSLMISFNDMKSESTVKFKLQSRGLILRRDQQKLRFHSSKDAMTLCHNKLSKYVVNIRKRVFKEEDPRHKCRSYPTTEYESYAECDDHYTRKKIEQIAPGLNLTPVWMTNDLNFVTSQILPADQRTPSKFTAFIKICSPVTNIAIIASAVYVTH